ncbi:MAG: hypothetical protein ACRDHZ_25130, partial [Ktedonobacteraceae bacterium]
ELALRKNITHQEVEAIIQQIADNPENVFSLTIDRLRRLEMLWSTVIKPVLGLLLVAKESVQREHLKRLLNLSATTQIDGEQLNQGLERLGGFVIIDDQQRSSLFHLKLRDYLHQDTQHPDKPYIFDTEDKQGWHRRFVAWCEQHNLIVIWDNTTNASEQARRNYARQYYIAHLYDAQERDKLFEVLDEGVYGKAKIAYDPTTHAYALDLDLGRKAAASLDWNQAEAIRYIPHLWRYTLLRCSLASRADKYSREAFELMLLLGYETKALRLAELLTDVEYKAQIFLLIASHLATQPEREHEALQLFSRAEQIADAISDDRRKAKTLVELAKALAQTCQLEEAQRVITITSNSQEASSIWRELEKELVQTHQWKQAEQVIAIISDSWSKVSALATLGKALAHAHQWEEAERVIATISDGWSQNEA